MESFGSPSRGVIGLCLHPRPPLPRQLLRQQKTLAQKQGVAFVVFGLHSFSVPSWHELPKLPLCLPLPPCLVRGEGEGGFLKGREAKKKGGGGKWNRTRSRKRNRKNRRPRAGRCRTRRSTGSSRSLRKVG